MRAVRWSWRVAAVMMVAAGCGSSGNRSAGNGAVIGRARAAADAVSGFESALRSQLGAVPSPNVEGGDVYDLPDGCTVYVLSGSATLRLYMDAGDPVVTDPSGRLGAKVSCDPASAPDGLGRVADVLRRF